MAELGVYTPMDLYTNKLSCDIDISIIYFKLAEITNGNEAEKLLIWAKYRQK